MGCRDRLRLCAGEMPGGGVTTQVEAEVALGPDRGSQHSGRRLGVVRRRSPSGGGDQEASSGSVWVRPGVGALL